MTEASGSRDDWTPDFPGQRPPFPPGHELSLVDGHRSERRVGPLAAQIAQDLLADPDVPAHLHQPVFAASLQAWAHAEATCTLLRAWLAERDIIEQLVAPVLAPSTAIYVTDGNAFFNRPGPRLVESLEIMAACVHPELFSDFASKHASVIRKLR